MASMRTITKPRLIVAAAAAGILCLAYLVSRPSPIRGNFPDNFSEAEKRQIVSAIKRDHQARIFMALRNGELRQAWSLLGKMGKRHLRVIKSDSDRQGGPFITVVCWFGGPRPRMTESLNYFMCKQAKNWTMHPGFFPPPPPAFPASPPSPGPPPVPPPPAQLNEGPAGATP